MTRGASARAPLRACPAGIAALLLLFAVAMVALILARRTIAEHLALTWLRRHGMTGMVNVRSLGLTGLEARFRLGPPNAPALTADSVEMGYRITGPWDGRAFGLEPGRLVFIAPKLAARYDGRRLDFGALQPIIDDVLAHPGAAGAPQPSIAIRRGRLDLATPYGPVTLSGDATLTQGRLDRLEGALGPVALSSPRFAISAPGGGRLSVAREGGVLAGALNGTFDSVRIGGAKADHGVVTFWARAPYPDASGLHGPAQVNADVQAQHADAGGLRTAGAAAQVTLNGQLAMDDRGQSFAGALGLRWLVDDMSTDGFRGRQVSANLKLTRVSYDRRDRGAAWAQTWGASLSADGAARTLLAPGLTATGLTLAVEGQAGDGGVRLAGRLSTRAGVGPGVSRQVIASLGLDRWAPGYGAAAAMASRDFTLGAPGWRVEVDRQGWRVGLPAPIVFAAHSGPRLIVYGGADAVARGEAGSAKGAFDAVLAGAGLPDLRLQVGGWNASGGRIAADLAAQARLDLDLARDVRIEVHGHAVAGAGQASFALDRCAPVSAATAGAGDDALSKVVLRLCPSGEPLAAADRNGWRIGARIEGGGADAPAAMLRIADVAAIVQARGRPRQAVGAAVRLTGARLSDLAGETRFASSTLSGDATVEGEAVRGRFALAGFRDHPLGEGTFTHDLSDGTGRAHFATRALPFATNGLQPSDIAPSLRMMRRAHGHVDFTGDVAWSTRDLTSSGLLSTRDLGFTSPAGDVVDAAGDIALSSLMPLTTAPNQALTARRVDGVVSISDVKVGFDASPTALDIRGATAVVAAGQATLDPFHVDLGPQATWRSTLRLRHVDLGRLIAASSLASSMKLEAVIDGALPFEAGPTGIRFMQGRIESVAPGRLTIARTALAGAGPAPGGSSANSAAQDFAYQALEDLAFDRLDAGVDSVAGDRLRVLFHIKGRHDPPAKTSASVGLWDLLHGKAFDKPLPLPSDTAINLTLDTSLNFGDLIRSLDAIWSGGARNGSPPVQGPKPPLEPR